MGLEVNELPFLLFCRQGQQRQQRQQGKQTLEVSWAVRGVLLEGGGSLSRLSFPFLTEAGFRPFRVGNFHARGARHSPQQPATADEPSGACPLFPCSVWGATDSAEGAHHFLPLVLAFGYRSATAAPAPLPLPLPLLAPFPWRAVPIQRKTWTTPGTHQRRSTGFFLTFPPRESQPAFALPQLRLARAPPPHLAPA